MSHIGKKSIFFAPSLVFYKAKNYLIVGRSDRSQAVRLQINAPLRITKTTSKLALTANLVSLKSRDWGTLRAHIRNIIRMVYKQHEIQLKFIGVGYKATLKKNIFVLRLGFSHKLFCEIPSTIQIKKIKKRPIIFSLKSHALDIVTQTAFRLRSFKKPEPYKGKGILLDNEFLVLKEKKKA
jgi:large subunit ribosomal protein L6